MNKHFKAWCSNPQQAAIYCQKHFPQQVQQTTALANQLCENTFLFREHWEMERTNIPVTFRNQIDWEYMPQNDPEWTYALNRHTCFVILAKTYLYTGNEKYVHAFIRIAESWLQNAPLTSSSKNTSWRSLEAGLRVETWLRSLLIFKESNLLSETFLQKMNEALVVHAEYLLETNHDFHRLSNWGVLQDHGLFLLGLYFQQKNWCETAIARLSHNAHLQIFRDGSHWEQSPMYHCEVQHCFVSTIMAAQRNAYVLPQDFTQQVQTMCRGLALWVKPNGYVPMQGDSDDIDAKDMLAQAAIVFNDGVCKHYAHNDIYEETVWDFDAHEIENYHQLKSIAPQMASHALADSGNYFLQSDVSSNATWLHFHCGCLGSGHGHAEQLHVNISANGEDVLIDSGRYTYVDSKERAYLKSAKAHNTTLVDKREFSEQVDTWKYKTLANPLKGEFVCTPQADYVSGGHLGYLTQGVVTTRKVLYIKPNIYVIVDTFFANDNTTQHTYDQFWHFGNGTLTQSENTILFEGEKTHAQMVILQADEINLTKQMFSPEYNLLQQCPTVQATTSAKGIHNFITVVQVGDNLDKKPLTVSQKNVCSCRGVTDMQENETIGLHIQHGNDAYHVLFCLTEVISQVDLLQIEGCPVSMYGKVVVHGTNLPQNGICLCW